MKNSNILIRLIILAILMYINPGNAFSFIQSVSPEINSQYLDTRGNIVVRFVYEMNVSTLNDQTIIIDGSQSGRIHSNIYYDPLSFTATIDPVRNMKAGENIHVNLTMGIQTLHYGNISPYMYNFKVKPTGGSGVFNDIVTSNLGPGSLLNMNSGDFDGDGDLDLIVIRSENGANKLFVFKNNGTGRFTDTTVKTIIGAGYMLIGDYDNDGDLDAAVVSNSYYEINVSIYKNNGSGKFAYHSGFNRYEGISIEQGDIDNDGDIDFVLLNKHSIAPYLNNGDGVFENSIYYVIGCQYYYNNGANFTLADFDADNDPDIYYMGQFREEEPGYICRETRVYLNNGNGGFDRYTVINPYSPLGMVTGDLNNDRKIDIIMPPFQILYFVNFVGFSVGAYPGSATTGDFDGDGDLDLINAGAVNSQPIIYSNDGNGNFSTGSSLITESEGGGFPCGDFDNDGDLDILKGGSEEGVFSLYKNSTPCSINGPSIVLVNSTNLFSSDLNPDAYFELSNYDQADARIISDSHNDSVIVDAGSMLGHFILYYVTPDFTICSKPVYIDSPMPVELTDFSSIISLNDVTLQWSTSSELNNSGFEIERSIVNSPNLNVWNKIGFVSGNGTSTKIHNYNFSEKGLSTGKYKYRLKQIDFNGNFKYFELAEVVSIGIPDKYYLAQNYPNPFNPVTNIELSIPELGFVTLKIYDLLGRELVTLVNEIKEPGYYKVKFDAGNLSSGVYFYRMTAGDFVAVKRFIILK